MSEFDIFDKLDKLDETKPIEKQDTGCKHLNITDNEIIECTDCGEQLKNKVFSESKMYTSTDNRSMGDGNRCWMSKKKAKGVREDLKGLGFPDPVINVTEEIFKTVTENNIYRVDKRKSVIVACLMEAYKVLNISTSMEYLLQRIPIENVTIGTRIVETKIKKYDTNRKRVTYTSPEDSIRDIMTNWESDNETIAKIIELFHKVDDKSSLLNRSRTKSVAAGIIYYYVLATNRNNIKLKEFSLKVELSESTIQRLAREVSAILGTMDILPY